MGTDGLAPQPRSNRSGTPDRHDVDLSHGLELVLMRPSWIRARHAAQLGTLDPIADATVPRRAA